MLIISRGALMKLFHPYIENGPTLSQDIRHIRISPWLWFSSYQDGSPYPCHCRRRDISHEQLVWTFMLANYAKWYSFTPPITNEQRLIQTP